MDAPHCDSRGWTGELGEEYVPPARSLPPPVRTSPFRSRAEGRALLAAILLIGSPLAFLLARRMVEAATPGLLVTAPALPDYLWYPEPAGLLFLVLIRKTPLPPRWLGWPALAGAVCVLAGAVSYFATGIGDSHDGMRSLPQRAYVEASRGNRRGRPTTLFRLQDGRGFVTNGFRPRYGDTGRCYSAVTRAGPNGFGWIELVDASPPVGFGQLAWPVDPARCFSATPLEAMPA